ncbi:hypothetical protein KP509_25G018900 [Ceratopteris richardii]|nr:hypothetical protein KP509_25G018900 [Ceratopteris richardii]
MRNTNKLHEVGLDISLHADGPHNLEAVDFDINVNSTVAVDIEHASCNVLLGKGMDETDGKRLPIGAVKHLWKKNVKDTQEKEIRTAVLASAEPSQETCLLSLKKNSCQQESCEFADADTLSVPVNSDQLDEFGAMMLRDFKHRQSGPPLLGEVCSEGQAEKEELTIAVTALHKQLKYLCNLAEKGSKDCGHCGLINEELNRLFSSCGYTSISTSSPRTELIHVPRLSSDEAQTNNSPVNGCKNEKGVFGREAYEANVSADLRHAELDCNLPAIGDTSIDRDREINKISKTNVRSRTQETSDAECHLCIELASSQSEDVGAEELRGGFVDMGHSNSNTGSSPRARECSADKFHACLEDSEDYAGILLRSAELSAEAEKHGNNPQGVGVEGERLVKVRGDEDQQNSAVTGKSYQSYISGIEDQSEKDGYIDLKCGCTSQKYGDTIGILRLYHSGKLEIQCQCSIACIKGKLTFNLGMVLFILLI